MDPTFTRLKSSLVCVGILAISHLASDRLAAQSAFRKSLDRLDRNKNGMIEPEEITPLSRPFLQKLVEMRSRPSGVSLERPTSIERFELAGRIYFAQRKEDVDENVDSESKSTVKTFAPDRKQPLLPGFGPALARFPYTLEDLEDAGRLLRAYDRNDDGFLDRSEAARNRWRDRNPFADDADKDDRLSRMELAQRYAWFRRQNDEDDDKIRRAARQTESNNKDNDDDDRRRDEYRWMRSQGGAYYLASNVMERFDLDRNGHLELAESQNMGIPLGQMDSDRDSQVSRIELFNYLTDRQSKAGDYAKGLPSWFYEQDVNQDRQVALSEYTQEWTEEKLKEFQSFDLNGDGFLTTTEVAQSKALAGGSYQSQKAEILPPSRSIVSEIEVDDDFLINKLSLQLSITHSNLSDLDAYLTGPDGQRIELFAEVGDRGNNFEETIFDDKAESPITKGKPPFKGTYIPSGLLKRQPGLSHFHGKSVKGVWQLVIRCTRSERFGMLHSWRLLIQRDEDLPPARINEPEAAEQPQQEPGAAVPQAGTQIPRLK